MRSLSNFRSNKLHLISNKKAMNFKNREPFYSNVRKRTQNINSSDRFARILPFTFHLHIYTNRGNQYRPEDSPLSRAYTNVCLHANNPLLLTKIGMCRPMVVELTNIEFHANSFSRFQIDTDEWSDFYKGTAKFRSRTKIKIHLSL